MKLIVGLGNPGKEYENTRHNIGFKVLDEIAKELNVECNQKKFSALIVQVTVQGEKVILMKPQTFMNCSGEAVIKAMNFYQIPVEDLIVIHDDLDLPVGKLRIRKSGSSGGQKGMKNIMDHVHSQDITRLRLGIDKSPIIPVVDYVLGKFSKDESELVQKCIVRAKEAAIALVHHELGDVMTRYNIKI